MTEGGKMLRVRVVDFKEPVFSECEKAGAYAAHSDCGGTCNMSTRSSQVKYGMQFILLFEENVYIHFVGSQRLNFLLGK